MGRARFEGIYNCCCGLKKGWLIIFIGLTISAFRSRQLTTSSPFLNTLAKAHHGRLANFAQSLRNPDKCCYSDDFTRFFV